MSVSDGKNGLVSGVGNTPFMGPDIVYKVQCLVQMKQLDVVVSPPTFVWDPYMTLTNVTFDPDPKSNGSRDMNFYQPRSRGDNVFGSVSVFA